MKRKIFVFDLDGTLCKTTPQGQNNMYMEAIPYKSRIEAVNKLFEEGNIIIKQEKLFDEIYIKENKWLKKK